MHDDSENGHQARTQIAISELFIEVIEVSSLECHANELVIPMLVNNTKIDVKIDTGAQCNVIPAEVYKCIKPNKGIKPNLIPCNTKLKSYSGNSIPILGRCTMPVQRNNKSVECDFFVVDLKNARALLGLESCQELNILKVNSVEEGKLVESNDLIVEYKDIFNGLGKVEGKFNIKTLPNASPVIHATRKISLSILPKLEETLERLIDAGVISRVTSPTE